MIKKQKMNTTQLAATSMGMDKTEEIAEVSGESNGTTLIPSDKGPKTGTEDSVQVQTMGTRKDKEDGEKEWVTPTKIGRSPVKEKELRYGEVSIMTNSFSCLSNKGEKGELMVATEEDKENLVNVEEEKRKEETALENQLENKANGLTDAAEVMLRQSLPRVSKESRKFLSTNAKQGSGIPNPTAPKTRKQKNLH